MPDNTKRTDEIKTHPIHIWETLGASHMGNALDRFISWLYIRRIWGSRCPDFEPTCACCQKWAEHDELFS